MESDLLAVLEGNAGVSALVGARIYPLILPQRVTLPAIRYQVISTIPQPTHNGASGLRQYRIQLSVHAATYSAAQAVAEALHTALDAKKAVFGSGTSCTVANDVPGYDEESGQYMRHVDVEPWWRE